MGEMGWTDARVETLKKLWKDGLSASQIAVKLGGVTRNAVIGKAHRLGIATQGRAPASTPGKLAKPARHAAKAPRAAPAARVAARALAPSVGFADTSPARAVEDRVAAAVPASARPWTSRGALECAFPVGGEGADTLSCCAAVVMTKTDIRPYCAAHKAVMFRPLPPKKEDTRHFERMARRFAA